MSNPYATDFSSSIPIIVGVTGHRDVLHSDLPRLSAQIANTFQRLQNQYTATPLVLLSPLAEGADSLVAEIAIEHKLRLIVPLPMPRSEYESQFKTPAAKQRFDELIKAAAVSFVVPLAPGFARGTDLTPSQKYAQVGAYIAYHSHILLALWDGDSGAEGGTSQIVDFKLKGISSPYANPPKYLDIIDNGPVYHILTPRETNPTPKGTPFALSIKFPEGWSPRKPETIKTRAGSFRESASQRLGSKLPEKYQAKLEASYEHILARMDTFNSDTQRLRQTLATDLPKNRARIVPDALQAELSERDRNILSLYALADTLAQHFQKRRLRVLITLFALALFAVASFGTFAHLYPKPWILVLYFLALAVAFSIYVWSNRKDFQDKHLDYRALAEGLRVQFFWNLAGLSEEVAERYLRLHRTELEWIRNAIRAWNVRARNIYDSARSADQMQLILTCWIDREHEFFRRRTNLNREYSEKGERWALVFFVLSLTIALSILALHLLVPIFAESEKRHWLIVLMIILAAIATAIEGYVEKMAFSVQAKRYEWMAALFERAGKRLRAIVDDAQPNPPIPSSADPNYSPAQQLLLDLGCEALEENGDWVMIHREKTADVYKGA